MWNSNKEAQLVKLWEHTCLYDVASSSDHDHAKRDTAWKEMVKPANIFTHTLVSNAEIIKSVSARNLFVLGYWQQLRTWYKISHILRYINLSQR